MEEIPLFDFAGVRSLQISDIRSSLSPTGQRNTAKQHSNLNPADQLIHCVSTSTTPPDMDTGHWLGHQTIPERISGQQKPPNKARLPVDNECTDACVVIPCVDPGHGGMDLHTAHRHAECGLACLEDSSCVDCTGFEEFLQCCTDYHSYQSDPQNKLGTPWESSFDEYMCACGEQNTQMTNPSPMNQSPYLESTSHFSSSTSASPAYNSSDQSPHLSIQDIPFINLPQAASVPQSQQLPCMWGNCNFTGADLNALVGHVNLEHLRMPPPAEGPALTPYAVYEQQQHQQTMAALSCLWRDCTEFPSPSNIPGPSSGNKEDAALDFLHAHLLQDHLGVPVRPNSPVNHWNSATQVVPAPSSQKQMMTPPSSVDSAPSPPPHECTGTHICQWASCGQTFNSCDDLTSHLTAVHVGAGKARYECFWEGCNRHGDHGFTSKQKICRHLQSHTGHRPFQCTMCKQNFSEAATLQQHMRRHTQEKPYVCDHPGCGKAFAITGALTIHKRVHNGDKPFKCTYCDRAFAESSNLSKHLRTHTGARPHICKEDGCGKAFARPDQLTRHMGVHNKAQKSSTKAPP